MPQDVLDCYQLDCYQAKELSLVRQFRSGSITPPSQIPKFSSLLLCVRNVMGFLAAAMSLGSHTYGRRFRESHLVQMELVNSAAEKSEEGQHKPI